MKSYVPDQSCWPDFVSIVGRGACSIDIGRETHKAGGGDAENDDGTAQREGQRKSV